MLQRIIGLLFGAVMALPAYAQDAGPLALEAGMRAYTTRVFVEPEVLAELSVGDEVSFFTTYFTVWDYPHSEGFDDTVVVNPVLETARILAIGQSAIEGGEDPLVEVSVRLEASREDIWTVSRADSIKHGRSFYEESLGGPMMILSFGAPLVMTRASEGLPEYCPTCETILYEEYVLRIPAKTERCYFTIRRGVMLERTEIPCPATE